MTQWFLSTVLLGVVAAAPCAWAQQPTPMPGMTMPGTTTSGGPGAGSPMMAAMDTMSREMAAVPMTGDADRDFAAMMIPHHRGAIEMARHELEHGKDPDMLRLARSVVAAQEKEIAVMRAWLAKHPGRH